MIKSIKIAIASGKGGTGKTLVSTNLFYILQKLGVKVTLIDCDAEEPNDMIFFTGIMEKYYEVYQKVPVIDENKCTYCSKCHEYCNYNAIFILPPSKVIKVIEDLCHGCGACLFACKNNSITEKDVSLGEISRYLINEYAIVIEARMKVGVFSPVSVIKAAINEADDKDIILLDAPPGTSCPFIHTVTNADYVILVTEPTPFGLSDLKQSVETLKTLNKSYGVIINRAGIGNKDVYNYLNQENIQLLMEIPFEKIIASYYSKGELVSNYKTEWKNNLKLMFDSIMEKYGNSIH